MPDTVHSIPSSPLEGLGPVFSPDIRSLILCSYPGKDALEKGEYYAGANNQFWALMSGVLEKDLLSLPYAAKIAILLSKGIGLWDVISAVQSKASLKTTLAQNRTENLHFLKENCPLLQTICFNGQPAGEYAPLFEKAGYTVLILPSSSPAYSRQSLEKKLESWQKIPLLPFR